jgi:tRNA1Val (adenine37-N6)-methyltransferase
VPNSYFKFKQFQIDQDRCAMKVCTDSCVFGAYIDVTDAKNILDIGTGTGLLSLMVAQRSEAIIQAIEINADAQEQARLNFAQSNWPDRLILIPKSLQEYADSYNQQPFDVIISNPPFFISSLKSPNYAINSARHTERTFFSEILTFAQQHLSKTGKLYLLLPPSEAILFEKLALNHGLHLAHSLQIYTQVGGKCIRHIQHFTFEVGKAKSDSLFIREDDAVHYTPDFINLLKDYYMIF